MSDGPTSLAGVQASLYWSSSASEDLPIGAWSVHLANGFVGVIGKHIVGQVWPVRGGQ